MIKGLLTQDIMFMQTQGKRIFFIIPEPEENRTMIGTTEREENCPADDVIINSKDINYMIDNINYYLKPENRIPVKPDPFFPAMPTRSAVSRRARWCRRSGPAAAKPPPHMLVADGGHSASGVKKFVQGFKYKFPGGQRQKAGCGQVLWFLTFPFVTGAQWGVGQRRVASVTAVR